MAARPALQQENTAILLLRSPSCKCNHPVDNRQGSQAPGSKHLWPPSRQPQRSAVGSSLWLLFASSAAAL